MTEAFDGILRARGRTVCLRHGAEKTEVRAFVQMIRKQETDAPEEDTEFGAADLRRWLYIGPKEQALQAGDTVSFDGADYVAQNAAAVYVGGEKSHWWAILRPAKEDFA